MQEKSEEKLSQGERLKKLRVVRQCNWADIAKDIELSEGMIYAVAAGKKTLSDKAIYRLEDLEAEAGIAPQASIAHATSERPSALREDTVPYNTSAKKESGRKLLEKIRSLEKDLLDFLGEKPNSSRAMSDEEIVNDLADRMLEKDARQSRIEGARGASKTSSVK